VQTYVQTRVLREAQHTFKWEVQGELVGLAAFDAADMEMPRRLPDHDEPIWYLRVVALSCAFQRSGRSQAVFTEAFRMMRVLDDSRDFVVGAVHPENSWSFKACAAVGLDKLYCRPDGYWVVMGEIP